MVETNGMILRALQIGIWVQEDYPERLTEEQKKLFDETFPAYPPLKAYESVE